LVAYITLVASERQDPGPTSGFLRAALGDMEVFEACPSSSESVAAHVAVEQIAPLGVVEFGRSDAPKFGEQAVGHRSAGHVVSAEDQPRRRVEVAPEFPRRAQVLELDGAGAVERGVQDREPQALRLRLRQFTRLRMRRVVAR
jgi:hypothetical protein